MSQASRVISELHDANNSNYLLPQMDSSKYDLKNAVKLPVHENPNEWIANNIFDFHKQICRLFVTISKDCTQESCPKMTAGKNEYLWSYGPQNRPVGYSASRYINHLLDWVQEQIEDEDIFPSMSFDKDFPPDFIKLCERIAKRLFRVYAHIYHHHLHEVRSLQEEAHMNTSLKHFIYFVQEFHLVSPNELEPLKDYIKELT